MVLSLSLSIVNYIDILGFLRVLVFLSLIPTGQWKSTIKDTWMERRYSIFLTCSIHQRVRSRNQQTFVHLSHDSIASSYVLGK
jgi:hypothetical protein